MHFKTIVYNNNPDNFVISMLGNFQKTSRKCNLIRWWHLDQKDGMEDQLKTLANTGLLSIYRMLTDSMAHSFFQDMNTFEGFYVIYLEWMIEEWS